MNKIAKSIKRLRTAQGLSQEELAERLVVSRQAISSWENNRTQPDLEMVGKLSEIFNVSVEELIYGEKRKTEIETEDSPHINKNMIIVFSVIGSVFVALALVFFLFVGWQSFNLTTKAVFGFLPLLAGQGVALFTYFKKFDKIAWKESAAILWCIGAISTFALINGIFNVNISVILFLTVVCLIIVSVIYLFDVVSPLIPYFALSIYFGAVTTTRISGIICCSLSAVFTGLGILYTILARKKECNPRRQFGISTSLLAVIGLLFIITMIKDEFVTDYTYTSWAVLFVAYFTGLVAYGKTDKKVFNIVGSLGLMVTTIILSLFDYSYEDSLFMLETDFSTAICLAITFIISAGLIAAGFLTSGGIGKDKIRLLKSLAGVAVSILCFVFNDNISVPATIIAMLLSVLYMLSGAKENNFFDFNTGLVALLFCIIRIIVELSDNMLILAFIFLISGVCLLLTNLALLKKSKKEKEATLASGGADNVQE